MSELSNGSIVDGIELSWNISGLCCCGGGGMAGIGPGGIELGGVIELGGGGGGGILNMLSCVTDCEGGGGGT